MATVSRPSSNNDSQLYMRALPIVLPRFNAELVDVETEIQRSTSVPAARFSIPMQYLHNQLTAIEGRLSAWAKGLEHVSAISALQKKHQRLLKIVELHLANSAQHKLTSPLTSYIFSFAGVQSLYKQLNTSMRDDSRNSFIKAVMSSPFDLEACQNAFTELDQPVQRVMSGYLWRAICETKAKAPDRDTFASLTAWEKIVLATKETMEMAVVFSLEAGYIDRFHRATRTLDAASGAVSKVQNWDYMVTATHDLEKRASLRAQSDLIAAVAALRGIEGEANYNSTIALYDAIMHEAARRLSFRGRLLTSEDDRTTLKHFLIQFCEGKDEEHLRNSFLELQKKAPDVVKLLCLALGGEKILLTPESYLKKIQTVASLILKFEYSHIKSTN